MDQSGIYEITCGNGECNEKYIGQTRRKLRARFNEHHNSMVKQKLGESSVADHMREKSHTFNIDNIKLIHQCYDRRRLDVLESIEIYKAGENLMNTENGPLQSYLFKYINRRTGNTGAQNST